MEDDLRIARPPESCSSLAHGHRRRDRPRPVADMPYAIAADADRFEIRDERPADAADGGRSGGSPPFRTHDGGGQCSAADQARLTGAGSHEILEQESVWHATSRGYEACQYGAR